MRRGIRPPSSIIIQCGISVPLTKDNKKPKWEWNSQVLGTKFTITIDRLDRVDPLEEKLSLLEESSLAIRANMKLSMLGLLKCRRRVR